jgi:hypothetical protein
VKTIGLVTSNLTNSEFPPSLSDDYTNQVGSIMDSIPEPQFMKTIGIIISKNSKSEGYPKIKNEKEHVEYINNIFDALGKPSPYEDNEKKE